MNECSSARLYALECGRHPILGADEELDLLRRAKSGDGDARDRLIISNQRFVQKIAYGYFTCGLAGPQTEYLDLVQWGNEGLIEAISRFDLATGNRFSTYAYWWVRAYMHRNLLSSGGTGGYSVNRLDRHNRIRRIASRVEQDLERKPTTDEIVQHTGENSRIIAEAISSARGVISLDAEIGKEEEGGDALTYESIPSETDTAAEAELSLRAKDVQRALSMLPVRDRRILEMRYGFQGEQKTFQQIGDTFGITRERARQLEGRAMDKLREYLNFLAPQDSYE